MAETQPKEGEQTQEETEPKEEAENEEEKPADEEAEPVEAEGEESPSKEGDSAQDKGEASEPAEARKRAGGWQRKIERLERQNEQLLAQLTTQRPAASPPPEAEKTPEAKAAEYIQSLVTRELSEREQQREQRVKVTEFQRRTAEVRALKPDFDDVVMGADMPISPALEQALLTSEHGPAIMYELAKSPAELARLCALPPLDAAREIGRLEARQASSTPAPVKTTKPALRPPAPPSSVNGSASSTRSLEDLPLAEYKRAFRSGRR